MWKCSSCQNENKDEYRFCLSCGNPRPAELSPDAPMPSARQTAPKKRGSAVLTVLVLIVCLLLLAAVAAVILLFPRMHRKSDAAEERTEQRESSRQSRRAETEEGEKTERGGTSSFIFGGESSESPNAFPSETLIPIPSSTQAPAATPEPSPEPTPEPTAAPISSGDYLLPDSSSRYLTEADLSGLSWEQCCLARNEIFARHGRIFLTPQIAAYFEGKSWYKGTISADQFSETVFNEYERANISFISQYESSHWGGSYY